MPQTRIISDASNANTQFIYYNGGIQGSYVFNRANLSFCGDNGTCYFAPLNGSFMRISVNPPWDANPFSFEMVHVGNDN